MQGFPSIAKYLIKITRSTSWISITCDLSHNKKKVVWGRRHQFQSWSHYHIIQWSYDMCVTSCRSTCWYLSWIYLLMPLLPSLCLPCWLWCNMDCDDRIVAYDGAAINPVLLFHNLLDMMEHGYLWPQMQFTPCP